MSGLTPEGLVIETTPEIRDAMDEDARGAFGKSLPLSDQDLHGQVHGIMAERFGDLWQLLQVVFGKFDPDQATGVLLEIICSITGTERRPAFPSSVVLTLTGNPGTLVNAGSRVSTESTGKEFETEDPATIVVLTSWVGSTAYTLGQRRTNDGFAWVVTVPGTSAASGGPLEADVDEDGLVVDGGTLTWRLMGEGTGAVDVDAVATLNGPTVALSGDLTEIETPISGWDGVINLLDADEGALEEKDEDLRVRREQELARAGTGPVDAIRADLLNPNTLPGITSVTVFNNPTDNTVDGMPPHSVEALIQGGEDAAIFAQLLASVAGGIQTHGNQTGSVADSQGVSHTVKFSRPVPIDIWVDITVEVDPATAAKVDVEGLVAAAIVTAGDLYPSGLNVRSTAVGASAFAVQGVLGTPVVEVGTAPAPSGSSVTIATRERAIFDTSRIIVTVVEVTP
jgi:uncharacterized phage protein gp47/JayE